jgi:D-xylose 1-dehydrogenase (NADP+, D-xylono-1,5-lactone-forming)
VTTPLRLGILSTARINGAAVLGPARESDRVEVVAVASRHAERARAYALEHGIPRAHGSYEALVADDAVDAVYISAPNSLHVEWSVRALEAGKHVLCEKSFAAAEADAGRAFDAADAADRVLMEAFSWRHHPQVDLLLGLVEDGAIGELRLVRGSFSFTLTSLGDVRMRPELGGGALLDVGCYCVHGARQVAGEPESVEADAVFAATGVDVRITGTMRFPGDVLAVFDAAFDLPRRAALEVVGSEGAITLTDPWIAREPAVLLQRAGADVERIEVEPADRFAVQLEHFRSVVAREAEPLLGRDDAVGQARALEALLRSAAEPRRR